jgi:hypothetical protein
MRRSLPLVLLVALTLPVAAATVKGTLTVNGKVAKLTNAYAATQPNPFDKKRTTVTVLLTDQALPDDAVHDTFAIMKAVDDLKFNGLSIQISDEKQIISGMIYSPNFKKDMGQISVTGPQKLETTDFSMSHVAGRVYMPEPDDFFDNVFQLDATFDVTTSAPPKPAALVGKPLPAGGGEPGKAYEAYRKLMMKGDIAGVRKAVTEESAKQMQGPDFEKMFEIVKMMQPKKVTITGGAVDGDTATLTVTSDEGTEHSTGTVTMVKQKGAWRLDKESWKTRSSSE